MKAATETGQRLFLEEPFVFISYAKEDINAVLKFYNRLISDNLRPWMDVHNIPAGYDWANLISTTIRKSRFFLVFLSARSVNKTGYIQKEISDALKIVETLPEGQVFVIPIRLEDCQVPERLSKWHWIDIYKYGGYKKLRDTLIHRLGNLYQLPTPARMQEQRPEVPSFKLQSDFLVYQHFSQFGSFVYGSISRKKKIISDGRFLEVRPSIPSPFLKLKPFCHRFTKMSAEALERVFPKAEAYKHEENKVTLIERREDSLLTLKSKDGKIAAVVNPVYWNYIQVRFPHAVTYLVSSASPIVFEQFQEVCALVMPMTIPPEKVEKKN